jgi:antitoxin HigA-1
MKHSMTRMHNPPHPGALLQECLAGVSITQAAGQLGVTRSYLSRILHGHADISADMALRLSDLLGTSAELWLGMQNAHDLWQTAQQPRPRVLRMTIAA